LPVPGLAVDAAFHEPAWSISTRLFVGPPATFPSCPTATQVEAEMHDTPARKSPPAPGFGLTVTDQVLPLKDSRSVWPSCDVALGCS